jgi:ketosteroid isomerase-like protein
MSGNNETLENKALVQASFDRWRAGTGSPFELLLAEADWTIVGSSPLSKTYASRQAFLEEVIEPFNARMKTPLVPTVRGIYADGDTVVAFFDASATTRDGAALSQHLHLVFPHERRKGVQRGGVLRHTGV